MEDEVMTWRRRSRRPNASRASAIREWKAVLLAARGKLTHRLGQSALVGLAAAVSAILFAVALGVLGGLDRPFERMQAAAKASQLLYLVDADVYDGGALAAWWKSQPETLGVTRLDTVYDLDLKPVFKDEQLRTMVTYVEYRPDSAQDVLSIVDSGRDSGKASIERGPENGEAWLPTSLANQYGIKPGDLLELPAAGGKIAFRVGAVVVDPQFSSGYVNPVRIWLAPGALSLMFPPERLRHELLCVRLSSAGLASELSTRFAESLGGAFNGTVYEYEAIRFGFTWMLRLAGGAMLAFSLLAGLACVFIVYNAVRGSIRRDFREIGILRAVGFTPAQCSRVYILQYLSATILALVPAVPISAFLAGLMLRSLGRALGTAGSSSLGAFGPSLIAVPVFLGLVALAAFVSGREAARLSPVEAMRFAGSDALRRKAGRPGRIGERFRSPTATLVIRALGLNRRRAAMSGIALILAAFVAVLSYDVLGLFSGIGDELGYWGFNDADLSLARDGKRFGMEHDTLMADFLSRGAIRAVVPAERADAAIPAGEGRAANVLGYVYDGDPALLGLLNLEGRHPASSGEISLATNTARAYGAAVGDEIRLFLYGRELAYRVSGIFQSVENLGQGFRLTAEGFRRADPSWEPRHYEILLHDPSSSEVLAAELKARWGEAIELLDLRAQVREATGSMVRGLQGALSLMALVFLAVALAATSSACAMDIQDGIKDNAILKSLGYGPARLRLALALKYIVVGLAGSLAGILLSLPLEPVILKAAMGGMGLESYRKPESAIWVIIVIAGGLFAALCTRGPSRPLKRVSVRGLIVE